MSDASDIFISYSHHDGAHYARELGADLKGRGFKVWLDDAILQTGDDLLNKIFPAIRKAGLYVPIISPKFCDAGRWAYREFLEALKEEAKRKAIGKQDKFIFPILHLMNEIEDPALDGNPDLKRELSTRRFCYSESWNDVVRGIIQATGIVEDEFAQIPVGNLQVGRFPVTNLEFKRFVNEGGYTNEGLNKWWSSRGKEFWFAYAARRKHKYAWSIRTEDEPIDMNLAASNLHYNRFNQPVTGVSYFEAEAYCNWLSSRNGKNVNCRIRLPTEQEWISFLSERHGEFPWGSSSPAEGQVNILFDKISTSIEGEINLLDAAKIKYPSIFGEYPEGASYNGCHDLIGNVWEWTSDFITEGEAFEVTKNQGNVAKIMGNCCFDSPSKIKFPPRELRFPGYRHYVIGFRVVQEIFS